MTREDKYADKSQQMAKIANILFDIRMWKKRNLHLALWTKYWKKEKTQKLLLVNSWWKLTSAKLSYGMNEFD